MTTERIGELTIHGNPLTVLGDQLKVGDQAPDFTLSSIDLQPITLADSAGKTRVFSVVPSLDTGICDAQTRRWNDEATAFSDTVMIYAVSADLPFAQKRWCGAAGVERVQALSDHMTMGFGDAYGTHIKETRIHQRAMFIVDKDDVVRYVEYVPEIAQHPDYDAALAALKEVAG